MIGSKRGGKRIRMVTIAAVYSKVFLERAIKACKLAGVLVPLALQATEWG